MNTQLRIMMILGVLLLTVVGCAPQMDTTHWHAYGTVEVPEGIPVPTITIELSEDASSGWNLHVITENFVFAPEHAGTEHYPGEGHAHIYVNGRMHARMYGQWFHLPQLGPGRHQIMVTLNSNDHNAYTVNEQLISDMAIVTVSRG